MKFEDSVFFESLKSKKISFPFGDFYLLKRFIVAEIKESVHFDWDKVEQVIAHALPYYEDDFKIGYIANRINSYSIDPQQWKKVSEKYEFMVASAIVSYNDFSFINATIEKQFSPKSIKRCDSLEQAINWILNLKEFKIYDISR